MSRCMLGDACGEMDDEYEMFVMPCLYECQVECQMRVRQVQGMCASRINLLKGILIELGYGTQ